MNTDHLPFRALSFDTRTQRSLIPARLKKLVAEFDVTHAGAITVSRRDGRVFVIDGQHRVRAAMERGLGDTKALCHVWSGLSLEEEAAKFLALNDVRSVSAIDKYEIGLVANDPACVGVRDILAKHGLRVAGRSGDGVVRCVSKALALYDRDPALLDSVCLVLTESWGTRQAAFEQLLVAGLGTVCDRYNGEMDHAVLVKKLAKYRGGPAALEGDARGLADYKPISVTRAVAEIVVDTYNRGRRAGLSPL
jgi:hypothetical protein